MRVLQTITRALTRKKHISPEAMKTSHLVRYMTTLDLTLLGTGNTLGAGVYVVTWRTGEIHRWTGDDTVLLHCCRRCNFGR